MNDQDQKKLEESLQSILEDVKDSEGAKNALALLFPRVERILKTYVPSDYADPMHRKRARRISDLDSAPGYFRLDPRPASWSKSEIEALLNSDNPERSFEIALQRINHAPEPDRRRLRYTFLEFLDGAFGPTRPFTESWLKAIVDFSPPFLEARDSITPVLFEIDNAQRIRWVIISAVKTVEPIARTPMFVSVTRSAKDITVLCDVARTVIGDLHPKAQNEPKEQFFPSPEDDLLVRHELLTRVRTLAATGAIWSQAEPRQIIWFWWGSNCEEEVRRFTESAMRTKKGLRALLDLTVNAVQSSGGNYERVNHSSANYIVNLDALENRTRQLLNRKNTTKADKALARRFLDALERGKSESF